MPTFSIKDTKWLNILLPRSASAYEKHISIRSGKQTTYTLSKLKGNAIKDQHRNGTQPTPYFFHKTIRALERYEHFKERERMKEDTTPKKLLSPKGAIDFSERLSAQ